MKVRELQKTVGHDHFSPALATSTALAWVRVHSNNLFSL
jgi:hypothetical protein